MTGTPNYSSSGFDPGHGAAIFPAIVTDVDVECGDSLAKFWLSPVRQGTSGRFARAEIGRIGGLIQEHRNSLMKEWHDYFGD